ncbi:UDP-N-acetylmuramate dehydrogenase [Candidatus Saccharibacteria bacterium]|nr:UDP-N-acetylmuramate dehydrogenase [Candidatus Saccharibacteria bacterium]
MQKMQENVPIKDLTTMKVGGPARYVQEITSAKQLPAAYQFARENELPVWVLGNGANTLAKDEGFGGLVLLSRLKGVSLKVSGNDLLVAAAAGEEMDDVVEQTAKKGYTGLEGLTGIPGTVGAAPVQNIGAYGQEIKDTLVSIEVYDAKTGKTKVIPKAACKFGYRESIFNTGEDAGRYFILKVHFKLRKGQMKPPFYVSLSTYLELHGITDYSPMSIRKAVAAVRAEKLPDVKVQPSAGSFFKNVYLSDYEAAKARAKGIQVWLERGKNIVPSGWLIEQTGLKGQSFYGFKVWDKAALILVNEGGGDYVDLAKARREIVSRVEAKFGYTLEQEPMEME